MQDNYADLSVLMSVYFKERPEYLKESFESILNQTVKAREIVLIKDGPLNKDLDQVINEYVRNNPNVFKIIELEQNVGLGKALALGVEKCTYNLIARMDTDDICRSDRFEKQLIEFQNDPNLAVVGSQIIEFSNTISNELSRRILPTLHSDIYKFARYRNPFNHVTVMFRKGSVIEAGNYIHACGAEDYYLWARLLQAGFKTKNLDDYLVYVRTGVDMFTRRHGFKYMRNALQTRRMIYGTKLMGIGNFILSSFAIGIVSIMPISIKKTVYYRFLRG